MASIRQEKYGALIQKEISSIFQQNARTICMGAMVSVTVCRVTSDLALARVYLSIFGGEDDAQTVFENIQANVKPIKGELSKRIGKQVRRIPDLVFAIDDSLDYAQKIDDLLKK